MSNHIFEVLKTDQGLKLASFFLGLCGALLGVICGMFLFFWKEGRERRQRQLAACRSLVMLIRFIEEHVARGAFDSIDIKLDVILSSSDLLMRQHSISLIMNDLVRVLAEIRHRAPTGGGFQDIKGDLDLLRRRAEAYLNKSMRSFKRLLFLC